MISKENKRLETILIVLIISIGLIPRLWRINTDLQIHFDQGLHSMGIWNIWHEHRFSLLGHQTDTDGIFHGPLYYWFMTPAYILGKGDPSAGSIFQIFFDALGMVFLFQLCKRIFNSKSGLTAIVIYSVSYGVASFARWLNNVTPTLPLSAIFLYYLHRS